MKRLKESAHERTLTALLEIHTFLDLSKQISY